MRPFCSCVVSIRAAAICLLCAVACAAAPAGGERATLVQVAREVQPKVVKLYGAGGMRGLEGFQSGLLVSKDGYIVTVWSYVLDADQVTVVLDDGRRFEAEHVGADPLTEIAVLKIDPEGSPLPFFDLNEQTIADQGARVLAFSNLFGIATGNEPVSMLQGIVSTIAPLEARRGAFATPYRGSVYVIDAAANNPGAAGGALTNSEGRLLGMLGKELRSSVTGTWLNYALPTSAFAETTQQIIAGKFTPPELTALDRPYHPLSLAALGIVLVPDVVTRTPPYIDRIVPGSPGAVAGLSPDDLLMMVDAYPTTSCREAAEIVGRIEAGASVRVAVLRGETLLEFTLSSAPPAESDESSAKTIATEEE